MKSDARRVLYAPERVAHWAFLYRRGEISVAAIARQEFAERERLYQSALRRVPELRIELATATRRGDRVEQAWLEAALRFAEAAASPLARDALYGSPNGRTWGKPPTAAALLRAIHELDDVWDLAERSLDQIEYVRRADEDVARAITLLYLRPSA